ncbi:hypothetical protein L1887_58157 [Cichorium endivia]|nr:hypothetical protein L1887_58157 [Cichorium endivia]
MSLSTNGVPVPPLPTTTTSERKDAADGHPEDVDLSTTTNVGLSDSQFTIREGGYGGCRVLQDVHPAALHPGLGVRYRARAYYDPHAAAAQPVVPTQAQLRAGYCSRRKRHGRSGAGKHDALPDPGKVAQVRAHLQRHRLVCRAAAVHYAHEVDRIPTDALHSLQAPQAEGVGIAYSPYQEESARAKVVLPPGLLVCPPLRRLFDDRLLCRAVLAGSLCIVRTGPNAETGIDAAVDPRGWTDGGPTTVRIPAGFDRASSMHDHDPDPGRRDLPRVLAACARIRSARRLRHHPGSAGRNGMEQCRAYLG